MAPALHFKLKDLLIRLLLWLLRALLDEFDGQPAEPIDG